MFRPRFYLLLAVLCSYSYLGHTAGDEIVLIPVDKHTTTLAPDTTTESTTTTTPSTTTPSTTTSSTTTSSTTTPSTTTSSTTTTTTSTTTPSTTTSSTTTPAPTTPAPTPAPTPLPNPTQGLWNYTDPTSNVTCIATHFAAQLNVTYSKNVNKVSTPYVVVFNVPADAKVVDGNCTGDQWMTISWPSSNVSFVNNMTIVYHNINTTKTYEVKSFNISLAPDNFPNASSPGSIDLYHGPVWEIPLATSYRCKVPISLNMSSDAPSTASQLKLFALQEEAYRTAHGGGFSAARECGGGDVPDAVPIAVGCALGGLVVVVLIAYLVGRRRSAARGYLSM